MSEAKINFLRIQLRLGNITQEQFKALTGLDE